MTAPDENNATGGQPEGIPEEPAASRSGHSWESLLRGAGLVAVVLIMGWVAFNVDLPAAGTLQARIEALGWAGWLGFVGLYALVAVTPIPVTLMAMTGGLLFGVAMGSLFSVIGVLIGCWGAYWLARGLGHQTVRRLLGSHAQRVEDHLAGAGFQAVCTLRLLPGVPYWPVNYGSGAFGVSQRDFVTASLLSVIPGQVSLVALGAFVAEPSWVMGTVVVLAWAVVLVMTVLAYRGWRAAGRH